MERRYLFLGICAASLMNLIHVMYAEPQKVVFKNMSGTPQRVWIETRYALKKASNCALNLERMMCDIPDKGICSYGARGRTVNTLEIKFSKVGSHLLPSSSTPHITGLSGVKSMVTITGPGTYTVDNKEGFKRDGGKKTLSSPASKSVPVAKKQGKTAPTKTSKVGKK